MPRRKGTKGKNPRVPLSVGDVFGHLVVVRRADPSPCGLARWVCRCRLCGRKSTMRSDSVRLSTSCGCFRRRGSAHPGFRHGKSNTTAHRMLVHSRARAKKRGLEFNLRLEDLRIPDRCPVFGNPLIPKRRPWNPSLDRIDPGKGYVRGNIQIVSDLYNRCKSNLTPEQSLRMALFEIRRLRPLLSKLRWAAFARDAGDHIRVEL